MVVALFAFGLVGGPGLAAEPAAFASCGGCHAVTAGAPPGAGPNLGGLIGRAVAGDQAYFYSPALTAGRDQGLVWDRDRLDRFLSDPEAMFPGLWMANAGVRDAAERREIIDWIAAPD